MKAQSTQAVKRSTGKVASIYTLFAVSVIIMILGAFFSIYSICLNVSFKVINTNVPGFVFGLVVCYLGLRYFMMVRKLKAEVFEESTRFSWSNFKPRFLDKNKKR